MTSFFKSPTNQVWMAPDIEAAARVDTVYPPDDDANDVVATIVKSGETGIASETVEATDDGLDKEVKFKRLPNHAELAPVLILAKLPGAKTKGFLVSHSPKGRGLKTRFFDNFRDWFGQRHPHHVVELSRATPKGFYKKLVDEESLRRITLIRLVRSSDMIDNDAAKWLEEDILGKITTTIQPTGRLARLRKQEVVKVVKDEGGDLGSLLVFQARNTMRFEPPSEMRRDMIIPSSWAQIVPLGWDLMSPRRSNMTKIRVVPHTSLCARRRLATSTSSRPEEPGGI
jgi:hypothetical protein